jgi:hypothetical protein
VPLAQSVQLACPLLACAVPAEQSEHAVLPEPLE